MKNRVRYWFWRLGITYSSIHNTNDDDDICWMAVMVLMSYNMKKLLLQLRMRWWKWQYLQRGPKDGSTTHIISFHQLCSVPKRFREAFDHFSEVVYITVFQNSKLCHITKVSLHDEKGGKWVLQLGKDLQTAAPKIHIIQSYSRCEYK